MNKPLIRVMALHALAYCERLFYLEEVEEIRVADASVFSGRRLHEGIQADEGEWLSLVLESETLGLKGKVDCLRRRDGRLIPYEHKRGRCRQGDKGPEPWPSDTLQVSAYTLLLEEHTGENIPEARVRYHASNVTVRVPIDETARQAVQDAIHRSRELSSSVERPPITDNERLCAKCSLAPVCLPEEERFADDTHRDTVRLFPADKERKSVHITEHGARICRAGDRLIVKLSDGGTEAFPILSVGEVVIHGYAQVTTQAIHLCTYHEVGIHWITGGGKYICGLAAGASPVQRRFRQYEALRDAGFCLKLTRKLAAARIESQLRFLLRASRGEAQRVSGISHAIRTIRVALRALAHAEGIDGIRGHEGDAGRAYFSALPQLLKKGLDERLRFSGRNRRPPKDRFNAILSFGYALLYRDVMQAILAVGLEPAFGFYHRPRSASHPLALDLMELFRVPIWDMVVIASLNRMQWHAEDDFRIAGPQVWLSDVGRKKAVGLYEERKEVKWKHPVIGYALSYARLIELETRLLEKEWTGKPGLFAKMRLR